MFSSLRVVQHFPDRQQLFDDTMLLFSERRFFRIEELKLKKKTNKHKNFFFFVQRERSETTP